MPTTMFTNRVTRAVEAMTIRVDDVDDETRAKLTAIAALSAGDLADLGEIASRGMLHGLLTADEAQIMHRIRTGFADATLAERIVFMQLADELAKAGV